MKAVKSLCTELHVCLEFYKSEKFESWQMTFGNLKFEELNIGKSEIGDLENWKSETRKLKTINVVCFSKVWIPHVLSKTVKMGTGK